VCMYVHCYRAEQGSYIDQTTVFSYCFALAAKIVCVSVQCCRAEQGKTFELPLCQSTNIVITIIVIGELLGGNLSDSFTPFLSIQSHMHSQT